MLIRKSPIIITLAALSSVFISGASHLALGDDSTPATHKADNSGKNARDKSGETMTADRQTEGSKSDVDITREIRQALTHDNSLSTSAKNVKIVTKNGIVNLRGPVSNPGEITKIGNIAKNCAGVSQVENQLEVKN